MPKPGWFSQRGSHLIIPNIISNDHIPNFSSADEVFEANPDPTLYKSSSMEMLTPEDDYQDTTSSGN